MRKTFLLLLLLPQVMMAQYEGDCFTMEGEGIDMPFETTIRKDTTFVLDISEPIHGFYVTGTSALNDNKSFVRIILKDEYEYEHLVYENNYLLSNPYGAEEHENGGRQCHTPTVGHFLHHPPIPTQQRGAEKTAKRIHHPKDERHT